MKRFLQRGLQSVARRLAPSLYYPCKHAIDEMHAAIAAHEQRDWQSCGTGVHFALSARIMNGRGMIVGNNVHVGEDCYFHAGGGIQIGDNTHISRRVTIYSSDHEFGADQALPYGPERTREEVRIGKNVWIGMNACILPGVTIGDGAIIAMGCIVSRDVARGEIVGQPAFRVLGHRSEADIATLDADRAIGGGGGNLLSTAELQRFRPSGRDVMDSFAFVVTTGRSGSTTIAEVLDTHPDISARHEPRIQLVHWSTLYERGEISRDDMAERLERLLLKISVYPGTALHLESDQKMSNLIDILHEIIPNARFIWLTRQAEHVVASTVARGWYDPDPQTEFAKKIGGAWRRYRVTGVDTSEYTQDAWNALTPFECNCWYWAHINRKIRDQLAGLPRDCWRWIDIGELSSNLPDLLAFLGVEVRDLGVTQANRSTYGRYPSAEWTPEQKEIYERHCGALMEEIYEARAFA